MANKPSDFFGGWTPVPFKRKNIIINGNFDVWQRGNSQTTGEYGSDDRWSNDHSGSTKTHSQQEFTIGQTDVPDNPRYFSRTVAVADASTGGHVAKRQKIRNVRLLSGKTITLTFYAKTDSAKDIAIEYTQDFGSGGSTLINSIGVSKVTLSTSWQKFEYTATLPSISGKTVGSGSFTKLQFWFDAGSDLDSRTDSLGHQSGTFDISQVQIEVGDKATEFEQRTTEEVLLMCQPYYSEGVSDRQPTSALTTTLVYGAHQKFIVEMIEIPTITFSGTQQIYVKGAYQTISPSTMTIYKHGFGANWAITGGTAGESYVGTFTWAADAEL